MGHASSKSNTNFTSFDNEVLDAKVARAGKKLQAIKRFGKRYESPGPSQPVHVDEQARRRKLFDFVRSQKMSARANYDSLNRGIANEDMFRRRFSKDSSQFLARLPTVSTVGNVYQVYTVTC